MSARDAVAMGELRLGARSRSNRQRSQALRARHCEKEASLEANDAQTSAPSSSSRAAGEERRRQGLCACAIPTRGNLGYHRLGDTSQALSDFQFNVAVVNRAWGTAHKDALMLLADALFCPYRSVISCWPYPACHENPTQEFPPRLILAKPRAQAAWFLSRSCAIVHADQAYRAGEASLQRGWRNL